MSAAIPITAPTIEAGAALTVEALAAADHSRTGTTVVGTGPRSGAAGGGITALAVGVTGAVAGDAGAGAAVVDALPTWPAAVCRLAAG